MNIEIISLSTATERRNHMISEMYKNNISGYQFFDAITAENLDEISSRLGINLTHSNLSNGEKGCLLSHIFLWKKMVDQNLEFLVILEDDVYLGRDAKLFLTNTEWIPDNVNIIKFESFSTKISVHEDVKCLKSGRKLFQLKEQHLGTAGYLLNREMAIKLLNYMDELEVYKPIDQMLFNDLIITGFEPIYQVVPGLSIQDFLLENKKKYLNSSIEQERKDAKLKRHLEEKRKRAKRDKIFREILRPFIQFYVKVKNYIYSFKKRDQIKMWFE